MLTSSWPMPSSRTSQAGTSPRASRQRPMLVPGFDRELAWKALYKDSYEARQPDPSRVGFKDGCCECMRWQPKPNQSLSAASPLVASHCSFALVLSTFWRCRAGIHGRFLAWQNWIEALPGHFRWGYVLQCCNLLQCNALNPGRRKASFRSMSVFRRPVILQRFCFLAIVYKSQP